MTCSCCWGQTADPESYHGAAHFRLKYQDDLGPISFFRWFVHGKARYRNTENSRCCGSYYGGSEARVSNEDGDNMLDLYTWSALEKSLDMLPPIPDVPTDRQNCCSCQRVITQPVSCERCQNYHNDAVYCSSACMSSSRQVHARTCLGRNPDPQREPAEQYFDWLVRLCDGREEDWEDDNIHQYDHLDDGRPADPMTGAGAVMDAFRRLPEDTAENLFKQSARWRTFFVHSFRRALLAQHYDCDRHVSVRLGETMCILMGYVAERGQQGVVQDGWATDVQDAFRLIQVLGIRTGDLKGRVPEKHLRAWCLRPQYCNYERSYES